jgi:methylenetetrahydrofolate dehydrogenase (NADP+)/methenyltetrahydrofolate cyclohydrolase/formyltetrahydrofolate synthetase
LLHDICFQNFNWKISYLPITPLEKVPSDIEVARAQIPKDVSIIASEVGLLSSEVDLFGKKKAKVSLSTLKRLEGRNNGKYVVVAGKQIKYVQSFN